MINKLAIILVSLAVLLNTASCGLIVVREKTDIQNSTANNGAVTPGVTETATEGETTAVPLYTSAEDTTMPLSFDGEIMPDFDVSQFRRVEELLNDPPFRGAKVAFCYEDLTTGYRYSYNGDVKMWAASVMKLPYALSILYKAESEDVGLDDVFVYTGAEYVEGTGVIKNMPYGSAFTVVDLIGLSIKHSDNIAQSQLRKKYGTDLYYEYVRSIGAESFTEEWGWAMTADHGATMLRSVWKYLEGDFEYSSVLKDAMLNTEHQVMLSPGLSGKAFARKYGWDEDGYNDTGIVYDEHPYILVFLSDMVTESWGVNGYISEIARTVDELHEEIWGTTEDAPAYTVQNGVQEVSIWDAERES